MTAFLDAIAAVLLLLGALLALTAAVGVLRFPDVLSRMHAATKPQVLGVILVMGGAALRLRNSVDLWMLVLVVAFQLITAPVAAHLVARLAYRTGNVRRDLLVVDELKTAIEESRGSRSTDEKLADDEQS